jgi:hypothetical protein
MKATVTVFFGAVVLAFLAAACSNPTAEAPRKETGRILVSIGIAGAESLKPVESRSAVGGALARTIVPTGLGTGTFTKIEAAFTATSGGQSLGPVTVNTTGSTPISLEVGTYTLTITAYTGTAPTFTAVAEGSVTGVVVTLGGSTPAHVLLGPKSGSGKGTFSYDLNVPTGATGTLTVTTIAGAAVSGGPKTLAVGSNTDTISLDAGYYQVLVSLSKGTDYAGFPEIIHIYAGLTSALPAQTFTDADFAPVVAASDLDLSGKFAAPVLGQTSAASLNAAQYTGTIAWSPTVSGTFAASTPYTATVSLTAKPGYTFTGVAANAFSHSGATSVSNSVGSGVVTLAFAATGAGNTGQASASYAVDNGEIAVTAEPANKTIQQGESTDLVLTVPAGYTVSAWYIDGQSAASLGTNLIATLDPDDYAAKTHSVTVFASKGGRPYSWRDSFTVQAAGGGGPTPLGLNEFIAAAQGITTNTPETPVTLALASTVDLANQSSDITALKNALTDAAMSGKYIVLDLRDYTTMTTLPGHPFFTAFNGAFATPFVVGYILPDTLTTIEMYAFSPTDDRKSGLRSITIPAAVDSIGSDAFSECKNLTRITFAGDGIPSLNGDPAFPNNFHTFYNAQSAKVGTYVWNGTSWSKE